MEVKAQAGFCKACQLPAIFVNGSTVGVHPWDDTARLLLEGKDGIPTATWHKVGCNGDVQDWWNPIV